MGSAFRLIRELLGVNAEWVDGRVEPYPERIVVFLDSSVYREGFSIWGQARTGEDCDAPKNPGWNF